MIERTPTEGRTGRRRSVRGWTLRSCAPLVALIVGCGLAPAASAATTWSVQATPNPAGSQAPSALANGVFTSVSCPSAGACTAVGSTVDGTTDEALAETWNGSVWSLQSPPALPSAIPAALSGVSCSGITACVAVGSTVFLTLLPLVETWDGTQWTAGLAGLPTDADAAAAALNGVSCVSAQACGAAGYTFILGQDGAASSLVPLAEFWTGQAWAAEPAPTPTAALSSEFNGEACTAAGGCTAVGAYLNSSDALVPLVETAGASTATIESVPTPTSAVSSLLLAVSCSASTACTATGASMNATGAISPLAERWNGTAWSVETTPAPLGSVGSVLSGVSCPAANACSATGVSIGTTGVAQPLAESWNGASWSIQSTPAPAGSSASALTAVSCTAASACTGVGESITGLPLPLAEGTGSAPSATASLAAVARAALAKPPASRALAARLPFPAGPLLVDAAGAHGRVTQRALASVLKAELATAHSR